MKAEGERVAWGVASCEFFRGHEGMLELRGSGHSFAPFLWCTLVFHDLCNRRVHEAIPDGSIAAATAATAHREIFRATGSNVPASHQVCVDVSSHLAAIATDGTEVWADRFPYT
jgi:hypothetical protein